MKKWRHSEVNSETGMVFVGYYKSCLNGEWWLTREAFDERLERRRLCAMKRYAEDNGLRTRIQERTKKWNKSPEGRAWDSARKRSAPELAKRRLREARRKEHEPIYRVISRIRNKMQKVLIEKRLSRSATISKSLGLSWDCFQKFISDQFADGMSWNNIGKWHIDHFVPISLAKDTKEVGVLSHYTNLQPLWAKDNLVKGDRLPSTDALIKRYTFIDTWNKNNLSPAQMGEVNTQSIQQ